jgi:hypothetical protein
MSIVDMEKKSMFHRLATSPRVVAYPITLLLVVVALIAFIGTLFGSNKGVVAGALHQLPLASQDTEHVPSIPEFSATQYQPSIVVLWNEAMLAAIRNGAPRPTVTARALYLVHQAMYDAWSVYDPIAAPVVIHASLRRPALEQTDANKAAAASQAAYHMLRQLYPDYEQKTEAFSRLLRNLGYEPVFSSYTTPAGIGFYTARAVLTDRAEDGANAANGFSEITSLDFPELYHATNSGDPSASAGMFGIHFNANHWEPLRVPTGILRDEYGYPVVDHANQTTYIEQHFLTPHWGSVRPFALSSGSQFRPPAPPKYGSDKPYWDATGRLSTNDEAYDLQLEEIVHLTAHLTDEQKVISEYWADGPRSETPPGHWNALAHGISYRDRHTIDQDIKLYFALNAALFDASIGAWDAKRAYNCIRPISAIRHKYANKMIDGWAGPDKGTQVIRGENWRPYQDGTFLTPPFPEFVSGHSTFSAAAAVVLSEFTGSNRFYDGKTILYYKDFNRDGVPDLLGQHLVPVAGNFLEKSPYAVVVLQWETFQEAADEAGMSRRYGGLHFQDGDLHGREMGRNIGAQAFDVAMSYWQGLR